MVRLPLNTLPAFRAVAQLQNLRAAAQTLNLTHGAVSQQIKSLETQLGFAVFNRRERRLVLNAAGQVLLQPVTQALELLEQGVQLAALTSQGSAQQLRISSVPSLANRWLLPRMADLRARHPELKLTVDVSQQVVDLAREGMHAAIRLGHGQWPGLVAERLMRATTRRVVVGNAEAAKRLHTGSPAAIAQEPLLGSRELWNHWFAQAGYPVQVTPVAEFNDVGLMLQAAEMGLGLAISHHILADDAVQSGSLSQISPLTVEWESSRAYYLVYPPSLAGWPPLKALRSWLLEQLGGAE